VNAQDGLAVLWRRHERLLARDPEQATRITGPRVEIEEEMIDTPAFTGEGLTAKIRLVRHYFKDELANAEHDLRSGALEATLADAERLIMGALNPADRIVPHGNNNARRSSHLRVVAGVDVGDPPTPAKAQQLINEIRHRKEMERADEGSRLHDRQMRRDRQEPKNLDRLNALVRATGAALNALWEVIQEMSDRPPPA
jgi:hypothetical protein